MSVMAGRLSLPLRLLPRLSLLVLLPLGCATVDDESPGAAARAARSDLLPQSTWDLPGQRRWLGPRFWANRLQDWQWNEGRIECVAAGWPAMRVAHDLVTEVWPSKGDLTWSIVVDRLATGESVAKDAAGGLLIGIGPELDHRARALVFRHAARGGGLFVGVDQRGHCFVRDNENGDVLKTSPPETGGTPPARLDLTLLLRQQAPGQFMAVVRVTDAGSGNWRGGVSLLLPGSRLVGGLALVSHPGTRGRGLTPGRFGFSGHRVRGDLVTVHPRRTLGPVLACQYTLSRNVLKLNAQFMPLGRDDARNARLEVWRKSRWESVASAGIEPVSHTALFRVEGWQPRRSVRYRVVYDLPMQDGGTHRATFSGLIRSDPESRDRVRLAALNCAVHRPWGRPRDWNTDLFFPHHDLVERVLLQRPDLLFFAGDQLYEGTPSPVDRRHIHEDYLYKWYLWCWSMTDLTRAIPTVTIPDDHDVYQGNLWGAGGRRAPGRDNTGGYVHPASFVKLVHRTQTAHLPDAFDPTPIQQDIQVYYTDLLYGGVSFAILADRMFKSGCAGSGLPPSKTGRPDHYQDPALDPKVLDVPGLKLLGDRQIRFLEHWAQDWDGHSMKVVLSQSPFAAVATHHGARLQYLTMDLDSNGWPQSGRNRALRIMTKARAVHVAGDQHLATLVQHGIEKHGDSIWSFTAPSTSNAYARAYAPECKGRYKRPASPSEYTGDRLDGLGNKVTVRAVANPGLDRGTDWPRLHDNVPGYGIVVIDKKNKTYTFECWPRFADPQDPGQQYEGWPVTVKQPRQGADG